MKAEESTVLIVKENRRSRYKTKGSFEWKATALPRRKHASLSTTLWRTNCDISAGAEQPQKTGICAVACEPDN
jgi:hypothetical protein